MKNILRLSLSLFFVLSLLSSCGGEKAPADAALLFSGDDSKTWVAKREYNSSGDKDKLNSDEKDQSMTFYRNGKFSMSGNTNVESGTWTYNANAKELQMVFDGSEVSENFQVMEMSDSKMKIKAGDGSVMILKEA